MDVATRGLIHSTSKCAAKLDLMMRRMSHVLITLKVYVNFCLFLQLCFIASQYLHKLFASEAITATAQVLFHVFGKSQVENWQTMCSAELT